MGFRSCASVVLLGIILTGCGGGGGGGNNTTDIIAPPPVTVVSTDCTTELTAIFDELLEETNRVRGAQGSSPLKLSQKLGRAAQGHAEDMANNNYFAHNSPDGSSTITSRIMATDYDFSSAAENLAAGYSSATDVVAAWLNSPGHQKNLLNPDYTNVGFGLFFDESPGTAPDESTFSNYWAQNFGSPKDGNSDIEAHYIPIPPENCNIGSITSTANGVLNGAITADVPTKVAIENLSSVEGENSFVIAKHDKESKSTPEPTIVLGLFSISVGLLFSKRNL